MTNLSSLMPRRLADKHACNIFEVNVTDLEHRRISLGSTGCSAINDQYLFMAPVKTAVSQDVHDERSSDPGVWVLEFWCYGFEVRDRVLGASGIGISGLGLVVRASGFGVLGLRGLEFRGKDWLS